MLDSREFWIGFASGVLFGAAGYRLYEKNQGELCRLIRERPVDRFESVADKLKRGIVATATMTHNSIEKASDLTQMTVDKAADAIKGLVIQEKSTPS